MKIRNSKFIKALIVISLVAFIGGFFLVTYQQVEQGSAKIESDSDFAKIKVCAYAAGGGYSNCV